MDISHYQSQAQLFRLLMHPVRIAILDLLRSGPQCVCHFEAHLGLRQSSISQQLAILRSAGLVQDRREGYYMYYQLAQPEILVLLEGAQNLLGIADCSHGGPESPACQCPSCHPTACRQYAAAPAGDELV